MQEHRVEFHGEREARVADGLQHAQVIGERDEHDDVVQTHDPFAFHVAVRVDVVEVVEKVAGREGHEQVGVPRDVEDEIGKERLVANDEDANEPERREHRVNERDLQIARAPFRERQFGLALVRSRFAHVLLILAEFCGISYFKMFS